MRRMGLLSEAADPFPVLTGRNLREFEGYAFDVLAAVLEGDRRPEKTARSNKFYKKYAEKPHDKSLVDGMIGVGEELLSGDYDDAEEKFFRLVAEISHGMVRRSDLDFGWLVDVAERAAVYG